MAQHKYKICGCGECHTCTWGARHCLRCRGTEGSLPTDCPGKPMDSDTQDRVFDREIDYVDGQWIAPETSQPTVDGRRVVLRAPTIQ